MPTEATQPGYISSADGSGHLVRPVGPGVGGDGQIGPSGEVGQQRAHEDALGLLHNADASRIRVITPVSVQLMEYFRKSGRTSASSVRPSARPTGRTYGSRSSPEYLLIARCQN